MEGQQRLFALATDALTVNAHFRPGEGWYLVFNARRQGDAWEDEPASVYSALSSEELVDTVVAELVRQFGL